jgi:hypothetical protein
LQIGLDKPIGNHPVSNPVLFLIFTVSIIAVIFFSYQKLKLLITEDEIKVSYGLLTGTQVIKVNEIKSIAIRKYNALTEFGGWGVRYNADASCFTVSGDDCIDIEMTDNRSFLIGTHKPAKVKQVIESLPIINA